MYTNQKTYELYLPSMDIVNTCDYFHMLHLNTDTIHIHESILNECNTELAVDEF